MTLSSSDNYRPYGPRNPAVETRLERFKQIAAFVSARGGWVTSLPGEVEVRIECLPDSIVPSDLRAIGYDLVNDGESERILHARICKVERYAFDLPKEVKTLSL